MLKTLRLKDSNYNKGMNTLDDPKELSDGECLELVNAYPGYPLRHRRACRGRLLVNGDLGVIGQKTFVWKQGDAEYLFFFASASSAGWRGNTHDDLRIFTHDELSAYTHSEIAAGVLRDYPGVYCLYYKELESGAEYPVRLGDDGLLLTRNKGESWTSGVLSFTVVDRTLYVTTPYFMSAVYFDESATPDKSFKAYKVPMGLEDWFIGEGRVGVTPTLDGTLREPWAYGYAFTLVRRPGNAGEKRTDYLPGDVETPERVKFRVAGIRDEDPMFSSVFPPTVSEWIAEEYGFTHIRVYRTRNLYNEINKELSEEEKKDYCKGSPMWFLCDIPIGLRVLRDKIPDGELDGEMNFLSSSQYTFPPTTGITYYFKGRMWIGDRRGQVYYSEVPGGDGGTDSEGAQMAANKYALWFRPLYDRVDLTAQDGGKVMGINSVNDDLILFSSTDVYMIVSGDPKEAPLIKIEDKRGCIYPESIAKIKVKGENALFYQSDSAPMVVLSRGYVEEFSLFKIAELYRRTDGELATVDRMDGNGAEYCSAVYWDDVLWLFYKLWDKSPVVFGGLMREDASGAFKVEPDERFERYVSFIAPTSDNKAYAIDDSRLTDWLTKEKSSGGGIMKVTSRKLSPGPLERNFSELFRVTSYVEFSERTEDDVGDAFQLLLYNNRYVSTHDYFAVGGNEWETALLDAPAQLTETDLLRSIAFIPKADFVGDYFQYQMVRTAPGVGRFFAFYGVELEVLPRARLDSEVWAGSQSFNFNRRTV